MTNHTGKTHGEWCWFVVRRPPEMGRQRGRQWADAADSCFKRFALEMSERQTDWPEEDAELWLLSHQCSDMGS